MQPTFNYEDALGLVRHVSEEGDENTPEMEDELIIRLTEGENPPLVQRVCNGHLIPDLSYNAQAEIDHMAGVCLNITAIALRETLNEIKKKARSEPPEEDLVIGGFNRQDLLCVLRGQKLPRERFQQAIRAIDRTTGGLTGRAKRAFAIDPILLQEAEKRSRKFQRRFTKQTTYSQSPARVYDR